MGTSPKIIGTSTGVCGGSQLDQSCSTTADCSSGACVYGKCSAVPNGSACTATSQCASGNLCYNGQCAIALFNDCHPHEVCTLDAPIFFPWTETHCVPWTESSTGWRCQPGGAPGSPCTKADDCALLQCTEGVCTKYWAAQYCDSDSECVSGNCFDTCQGGDPGAQCKTNWDCRYSDCDIPNGSTVGQCAADKAGAGGVCSEVSCSPICTMRYPCSTPTPS